MICHRDITFCSRRECANEKCSRHWNQVGDTRGLPVCIGDMKAENCGFAPRCEVCGSVLGDACSCHEESIP